MTVPFDYPDVPHVRRHGPQGYAGYSSYRPWLRDEFAFRCVYCLLREQWGRFRGVFDIDHFQSIAHHPERGTEYDNLLYTCATCNASKGGVSIPDPCEVLGPTRIDVLEDGSIDAKTPEARQLVHILGLDAPDSVEFRMLWINIVALALRYDQPLSRRLLGYPEELPDLRELRPPGGNSRPRGIEESHFARREQGRLPDTY